MQSLFQWLVSLAAILPVISCSASAQEKEPPLILEITSKLGVKTKVEGPAAGTTLTPGNIVDRVIATSVPRQLSITLDQGTGVYLSIPIRLVESAAAIDKGYKIKLTDGSIYVGKLGTVIGGDGKEGTNLDKPERIVNLTPMNVKKADPQRQGFRLRVGKPADQTFEVYAPGIWEGNVVDKTFPLTLNGENLRANPADFELVGLFKKEKLWNIKVKAPEAAERTGTLKLGDQWSVVLETTNGCYVVLVGEPVQNFGDIETPEFTLERIKLGASNSKETSKTGPNIIEKKK